MGESLVSGETLPDNTSHGTDRQQETWYPPEGFSSQMAKKTHGLQWDTGLGQWSPVSRQTLGGAKGIKITAGQAPDVLGLELFVLGPGC